MTHDLVRFLLIPTRTATHPFNHANGSKGSANLLLSRSSPSTVRSTTTPHFPSLGIHFLLTTYVQFTSLGYTARKTTVKLSISALKPKSKNSAVTVCRAKSSLIAYGAPGRASGTNWYESYFRRT